jgi:uncharacterized protein (TIGR02646 family)
MLRTSPVALPAPAVTQLARWQGEVARERAYANKVTTAKRLFSLRNRKNNSTFKAIKRSLIVMCPGSQRCHYCEDSAADEVEHIRPKDLYPELVFRWDNYVYSCGGCNGMKLNRFAVFAGTTAKVIDVTRPTNSPVRPPSKGDPVFLDLRVDDPTALMALDLAGTFLFLPSGSPRSRSYRRAQYTIELLGLNTREHLIQQRRTAFSGYRARLIEYVTHKQRRSPKAQLDILARAVRHVDHPTVWFEMKRQRNAAPLRLAPLFRAAPEALSW